MTRKVSYYDKQRASSRLAYALRALGWKTQGYKEDESDSMTDYYSPASWMLDAVATHPDFPNVRIGCNIDAHDVEKSGKPVYQWMKTHEVPCPRCKGAKVDPELGSWTFAAANADKREYLHQESRIAHHGAVSLFPMVNDRDFITAEDGELRRRCHVCRGHGTKDEGAEAIHHYEPVIKNITPRGTMCHIEVGDEMRVRFSYTGWAKLCDYDTGVAEAEALAKELTDVARRITEKATQPAVVPVKAEPRTLATLTRATVEVAMPDAPADVSVTVEGTYTWIAFPTKPDKTVLDGLKGMGARWAGKRKAWYFTRVVDVGTLTNVISN